MNILRNIFKNKEKPFLNRLVVLLCLGIILILISTLFMKVEEPADNSSLQITNSHEDTTGLSYEKDLEKRLAELLGKVDGAGIVDVMITLSQSNEIILAEDRSESETTLKETDATGGERQNQTRITDIKKIIIQNPQGGATPLIVKEIVPKIEGVIIVAQGGDDIHVKESLINAAKTVLGIEIHKVQVLKMK